MAGPSSVELEMEVTIFLTKNENFVQLEEVGFAPLSEISEVFQKSPQKSFDKKNSPIKMRD
jgi:ribosomal protein S1